MQRVLLLMAVGLYLAGCSTIPWDKAGDPPNAAIHHLGLEGGGG